MLRRNSLQWLGVILVSLLFFNACAPIQPAPASDAAAEAGGDEEPPERGAVAEEKANVQFTVGQEVAVHNEDDKVWVIGKVVEVEVEDDGTIFIWASYSFNGRTLEIGVEAGGWQIMTVDQAKQQGITFNTPLQVQSRDLTCAGEALANITPKAPALSQAEKESIVNAHNVERKLAGVSTMVVWDDKLAEFATGWVAALYGHNALVTVAPVPNWPHSRGSCYFNTYRSQYLLRWGGENIGTVQGFINEKMDYNLSTKTCTPGKVCGHYTNMINPAVTKIGCSRRDGGVCEYAQ